MRTVLLIRFYLNSRFLASNDRRIIVPFVRLSDARMKGPIRFHALRGLFIFEHSLLVATAKMLVRAMFALQNLFRVMGILQTL